jgi:outer membrane immunogenic protein
MKKLSLLLSAAALLASPAFAADLIVDQPDVQAIYDEQEVFDWNGAYVGVNAGVAWGLFEHPFTINYDCDSYDNKNRLCYEQEEDVIDLLHGSGDVTAGGFIAGVQAGYNVQMDNFVVGVEADIQHSTVDGRVSIDVTDDIYNSGDTFHVDAGTHLDWFGTLRLRAGMLLTEQALLYGTAGLAAGQTTSSLNASYNGTDIFGDDLTETLDRTGWAAGFGLEYALTDNVTVKTEYLYTDLGTANLFDGPIFGPIGATVDSTVAFHTVRAGLNFQF